MVGGIFDLQGTANQKQSICNYYSLADPIVTGIGCKEGKRDPPLSTNCNRNLTYKGGGIHEVNDGGNM